MLALMLVFNVMVVLLFCFGVEFDVGFGFDVAFGFGVENYAGLHVLLLRLMLMLVLIVSLIGVLVLVLILKGMLELIVMWVLPFCFGVGADVDCGFNFAIAVGV